MAHPNPDDCAAMSAALDAHLHACEQLLNATVGAEIQLGGIPAALHQALDGVTTEALPDDWQDLIGKLQ